MSQDNVEIVRRAIEAFNRRDFDAALRDAVPDAAVDMSQSRGPDAGIYVGRDAIQRFWEDMTGPFERHTLMAEEFIPRGEHVVVSLTARMTGRGGIEVEARTATVATFADGRLMRWTMYQDRTEALNAVGLDTDAQAGLPEAPATVDREAAIRRSVEAFVRRDFEAVLTLYLPDAAWDTSPTGGPVFEGREALRRLFEEWTDPYVEMEQELEVFSDLGNGVTFGVVAQRARLAGGEGWVSFPYAGVAVWAGGHIEQVAIYADVAEARAAAERLAGERQRSSGS